MRGANAIRELHHNFPEVSKTTIHEGVTEKLGYRKVWTRWVPKILKDDHKTKRMVSALKFHTRYAQEGDEFLDSIVTGNEKWVFTTLLNSSNQILYWEIVWRNAPLIWRDFGSALPFPTRVTQTKPVLPLSNEHGSQVKDQGRRQCCHNKNKNFPIGLHVIYLYFPDTPLITEVLNFVQWYTVMNICAKTCWTRRKKWNMSQHAFLFLDRLFGF